MLLNHSEKSKTPTLPDAGSRGTLFTAISVYFSDRGTVCPFMRAGASKPAICSHKLVDTLNITRLPLPDMPGLSLRVTVVVLVAMMIMIVVQRCDVCLSPACLDRPRY